MRNRRSKRRTAYLPVGPHNVSFSVGHHVVVARLRRLRGCCPDNVSRQGGGQFDDLVDPETPALRPVVEHGDAAGHSGSALGDPRHVDIEVLDSGRHAPVGRVARPSGEHLIRAIVEEPDLRMVVRLRGWDRNPEPKRPRGDHPCETVECMPGERRGIGTPPNEHVGDPLGCFLRRHPDAPFHGGAFVGEKRRGDGEVDGLRSSPIEVHGEPRGEPPDPPGREPAEGATDLRRCAESRYEDLPRHRLIRQLEHLRLKGALVLEHVYSTLRRCIMRSRIASASLVRGSSAFPSSALSSTRQGPLMVTRARWPGSRPRCLSGSARYPSDAPVVEARGHLIDSSGQSGRLSIRTRSPASGAHPRAFANSGGTPVTLYPSKNRSSAVNVQ